MTKFLVLFVRLIDGTESPVFTHCTVDSYLSNNDMMPPSGYVVISQSMLDANPNWLDTYRAANKAENVDLFWRPVSIIDR